MPLTINIVKGVRRVSHNEYMSRTITIRVQQDLNPREYADLANALWMIMRNTTYESTVTLDGKTNVAVMNDAWARYGQDANWR